MTPLPPWLKRRFRAPDELATMTKLLRSLHLHTVCESAHCPNIGECFRRGTATFLILGNICTRNCGFCAVTTGVPEQPDREEPKNVAGAARQLKLQHVVVTSVTRDDLADGGAGHFSATVAAVRYSLPESTVEILTPDFQGNRKAIDLVVKSRPDIFNHNLETVSTLYPRVRPQASYQRSLDLLKQVKDAAPKIITKSGFMLGLGENEEQTIALLHDIRQAGCDIVTIGQYLAPSVRHLPVVEYLPPERFAWYRAQALSLGFRGVASDPLVRSSYLADLFVNKEP
ncbi:MAG TPA: lipoyl synthase [Atribacteraceae bacterium]|nr:lipoyl synthase [Atribacteraceae bacterium]